MAKLADLKSLLDARASVAEAAAALPASPAPRKPAATAARAPAPPVANTPAPSAAAVKRSVAAGKHAGGDIDLGTAFAGVTRLPRVNRTPATAATPPPDPRQREADEADALLASKYGVEPSPMRWEIGQETEAGQTFLRKGLGSDVLVKLRRGHWSVQAEIDLHGHTSPEAHDALADFLLDARAHRMRCVRVIHGKGLTSPGGEPVLKGKVRRWLSHWDDVLAYVEAPQHAGGGGAVLVLLRGAAKNA